MLTILIGGIFFIVLYCTIANGEWGSAGIAAVILLFLIFMSACEREDTKVWANRQEYWRMNGKDRAKAQIQWHEQARAELNRERSGAAGSAQRVYLCPKCSRYVQARSVPIRYDGVSMRKCECPMCRTAVYFQA